VGHLNHADGSLRLWREWYS